jgi:protein-L-isoaspartate(D-aspartate) O-methyltransferase
MDHPDFAKRRGRMVETQIAARGVQDGRVLAAMRAVPREQFVAEPLRERACDDEALPIAEGQTISQPYIVALTAEGLTLRGGETVLEIGTGSGYAAAVLARLAAQVYTVERIDHLALAAAALLARLGCTNVHVRHDDGTLGWADHAPYDAIAVTAGGPSVPHSLKAQMKVGGRMVIPVGAERSRQQLLRVVRVSEHRWTTESLCDVAFVPLVGREGWAP